MSVHWNRMVQNLYEQQAPGRAGTLFLGADVPMRVIRRFACQDQGHLNSLFPHDSEIKSGFNPSIRRKRYRRSGSVQG
jgi:hypothetical protein